MDSLAVKLDTHLIKKKGIYEVEFDNIGLPWAHLLSL